MSQSSHINAALQPRPEAGAQRTLQGVGSSAMFGPNTPTSPALASQRSLAHLACKSGAGPSPSKGFEVTQLWDDLSAKKAD